MSESVAITLSENNEGDSIDKGESGHHNRFFYTKMIQNLDNVTIFNGDITDPINNFNEETLFHYCNVILDYYNSKTLTLGLFRNAMDYGPTQQNVDIYFHPFQTKSEWHLAIGFCNYSKILIVHCSNFTTSVGDVYPSFHRKTSMKIQNFIQFFKQKLSKNALKYPRLFTDLFEPATGNNAVNLLAVIFSFCLDAIALQRSFCDPEFSPSKFEISDIYPLLETIDINYRIQLAEQQSEAKVETNEINVKESIESENVVETLDRQDQGYITDDKPVKLSKQMIEADQKQDELVIENHDIQPNNADIIEIKLTDEHVMILQEQRGHKNTDEMETKLHSDRKILSIITSDEDNDHHLKELKSSHDEEINDLESSEELEEETRKTIDFEKTVSVNREKIGTIERIFQSSYAKEFMDNIYNRTELHSNFNLDLMFDFIQNVCNDSFTNPDAFIDKDKEDRFQKNGFKMRESLIATYLKGSKLEFDEDQLTKMLEIDYKNQIFPLIFINDSIFLVNFKTTDNINCIVRIFCISNRTNRSEREVLRNYALRRLVEMYVFKYHRLVTKIKLCLVPVKSTELYKVLMQTIFVVHKVMWRNKFDMNLKFDSDNLDNYTHFFENIMKNIQRKDIFQVELNWKRLVKHVLIRSKDVMISKSN